MKTRKQMLKKLLSLERISSCFWLYYYILFLQHKEIGPERCFNAVHKQRLERQIHIYLHCTCVCITCIKYCRLRIATKSRDFVGGTDENVELLLKIAEKCKCNLSLWQWVRSFQLCTNLAIMFNCLMFNFCDC